MDGSKFDWDSANTNHLDRHAVTREEFEETFKLPRLEEQYIEKLELRIWALGRTDAGRYLTVVPIVQRIRAVTAHTTKMKNRAVYEEFTKAESISENP